MRTALIVLLFASTSLAQYPARGRISQGGSGSSGGGTADGGVGLTAGDVWTTADMPLFVDPTGSDSNACTGTGPAACLTTQGCLNKFPKQLRHRVSCTHAAGSYAGFIISGFTFDPAFQKTTAGILIDGVQGNVTPATGSATGTATSATAQSGTTFATLTDTGATWTVNDFKGKFITITGGTGSGQTRTISTNTATVITLAGAWGTTPNATSTYAIQSPTSLITSTTAAVLDGIGGTVLAASGIQIINNSLASAGANTGEITIRNMGTSQGFRFVGDSSVNLQQVLVSAGTPNAIGGIKLTVNQSSFTTTTAFTMIGIGSYNNSMFSSTLLATAPTKIAVVGCQLNITTAAQGAVASLSGSVSSVSNSRCDCNSAATSACVSVGLGQTPTSPDPSGAGSSITNVDVTNCTYGVAAQAGGVVAFTQSSTFSGNSLTYSAASNNGGTIILPSAITITSGTADLSVDNGSTASTFGSLGSIYNCLTSLTTGSKVCRL